MHGGRFAARVALGLCAFGQVSCMALKADKHTYSASSPAVEVNGAKVRMQVKPEGTENGSVAFSAMVVGAAIATFDGPFRWRIEAEGRDLEHESLVVHRIRTRTGKTGRDEWYPASHLGRSAEFRRQDGGLARAVYPVPGMLLVKPREDGALVVTVDLTVVSRDGARRRMVTFKMDPAEKDADEFVFLPTEIAENIGKPLSEQDDKGWD